MTMIWALGFRQAISAINRIDEFIKNCNLNGWLVNAIDIQNRIEIHEKINEEIRFD